MFDLFMLFIVVSTIGMVAVIIYSALQNRMQPVKKVMVVAVRRRTREFDIDLPTNWWYIVMNVLSLGSRWRRYRSNPDVPLLSGEMDIVESVDYFITFAAQSEEIELRVPESIFLDVLDGERGLLTYQGEIFKGFVKDRTQSEPEPTMQFRPPPQEEPFDPNKTQQFRP
jgi:hypothetical protein